MMKLFYRIFTASLLFFLINAGPGLAQSSSTHTVQPGETLFSIAQNNSVSVQQIKQWNHLSGSKLSVGQKLVIKKTAGQQEKESASGIIHTVKPHETLFSISKKYNVSIADIKKWNDVQGQNLAVGAKLIIHPGDKQPKQSSGGTGRSTYTVKSGDSLFRIAHAHNMSIARLKEMNNLSSNNLQVGQKLILEPSDQPPSLSSAGVESSSQGRFIHYAVEKSQSKSDLLEKFQMDESEFEALNPGMKATSFRKGDEVNLLAPANQSFKNPYQTNTSMSSLGSTHATRYQADTHEPTTSGELYNPHALTAADADIALGSVIFVQNSRNKRGVFVRINDRTTQSGIKLSDATWKALALSRNSAEVTIFQSDD